LNGGSANANRRYYWIMVTDSGGELGGDVNDVELRSDREARAHEYVIELLRQSVE
jgi:hypothetical protein